MDSPSGTGVRPAMRVIMTLWLTPGRVYSTPAAAAAPEGGHPRGHVPGDAPPVQLVHLFPHRPVQAGVPGVEADGVPAGSLGLLQHLQHLLQSHLGAVVHRHALPDEAQQGGVHQAARVYHAVGLL